MSEKQTPTGSDVPCLSLLGIPVALFIYDGDETKAKDFANTEYTHVVGGLLHFERWSDGLGWQHSSIPVGGWLLKFNGKVVADGCKMPNAEAQGRTPLGEAVP